MPIPAVEVFNDGSVIVRSPSSISFCMSNEEREQLVKTLVTVPLGAGFYILPTKHLDLGVLQASGFRATALRAALPSNITKVSRANLTATTVAGLGSRGSFGCQSVDLATNLVSKGVHHINIDESCALFYLC